MPSCNAADRVAKRFLRALRLVGGMPQNSPAIQPPPIERPAAVSQTFGYYAPGQLLAGSGFRSVGGRPDYTVYSQIRFPLGETPTYAASEVFHNRSRTRLSDLSDSGTISYSWRDNFCERRGFPVAQCPAGIGHQGQDIRPAGCRLIPGTERCEQHGDVLAVRDGAILRSPKQEAAYLFVNTANEHVRFRYLHMSPARMDADNLLSGRRVDQGEVLGEVGNFSMKAAGTSYHLHFDIQVPTSSGWVFVNPYMTLVAAYERMIGARGTELVDPFMAAGGEPANAELTSASAERAKSKRHYVKQSRHRPKPHRGTAQRSAEHVSDKAPVRPEID
jgi:murein DD-endopeptidase MepM/ murein hydrolase activator NlpD